MAEKKTLNFEQAMEQLEQIVTDVEQGKVSLEGSIEKYEQGMKLIKHCREILEKAEKKIELVGQTGETKPLE